MRQKGCENVKTWLRADDPDVYFMKESDSFLVVSPGTDSNVDVKKIKKIIDLLLLLFLFP